MHIRTAVGDDLSRLAALAATAQVRPDRHIGYLGVDVDSIAHDIAGVERWSERGFVAETGGGICGWLLAEVDEEMDRAWWWGPFVADGVDWDGIADRLAAALDEAVPTSEAELAPDDRHAFAAGFAARHGFVPETASAVLSRLGREPFGGDPHAVGMDERHRHAVARLHDELFPGTHTRGASLVEADGPRLVAEVDGVVVGYVAAETQSDRSGYIDYLGVDPEWRGRGAGRSLVMAATDRLIELGATGVHLTVRESNLAARNLYASLGFVEERVIRPYRRGFHLE